MPWIPGYKSEPSKYVIPCSIACFTEVEIEYAKQQRKEVAQIRELMLQAQKTCTEDKESAKYFKDAAADYLKQYRGWDYAIAWAEGNMSKEMSESIAPYADRAFWIMDICDYKSPVLKEENLVLE